MRLNQSEISFATFCLRNAHALSKWPHERTQTHTLVWPYSRHTLLQQPTPTASVAMAATQTSLPQVLSGHISALKLCMLGLLLEVLQ